MSRMICPKCHRTAYDQEKYCMSCGTLLTKKEHKNMNTFLVIALTFLLMAVIGFVSLMNSSVTSSGVVQSYVNEDGITLTLEEDGSAVYSDGEGVLYEGTYTVSKDETFASISLTNEDSAKTLTVFFANSSVVVFEKGEAYSAERIVLQIS